MQTTDYITAAYDLLKEGGSPDTVFANLKAVLTRRGHLRLYKNILIGLERRLHKASTSTNAHVYVARDKDLELHQNAIRTALRDYDGEQSHKVTIDPTLIGGFAVEYGSTYLDNSYKSRLVSLYRSVIQ